MRICPRCNGTGGLNGVQCNHCNGLGYVKGSNRGGGEPRCRCGLIATFPEHDAEIQRLRNSLDAAMTTKRELMAKVSRLEAFS